MTDPGYPPPRDVCPYLGIRTQYELVVNPQNDFLFEPYESGVRSGSLLMINYPHNPSGQVMNKDWLRMLCEFCVRYGVRLFNDAAYVMLDHTGEKLTLAEIAVEFPELWWMEGFSASKIGNFTGWRTGVLVGSPRFIGDVAKVKADFDSGHVAPMAFGILEMLRTHPEEVEAMRQVYKRRLDGVISVMERSGMKLAFRPRAGAFSLWEVPKWAFGKRVADAKQFNYELIHKTGVVGTDFHPYYRIASFGDVEPMLPRLELAFKTAQVSY